MMIDIADVCYYSSTQSTIPGRLQIYSGGGCASLPTLRARGGSRWSIIIGTLLPRTMFGGRGSGDDAIGNRAVEMPA
jgi:hypothetical protein